MPSKFYNLYKKAALSLLNKLPSLPANVHGRWVWIHPRARFSITTQTFYKREPHVRSWIKEQLSAGKVFFDVGAHHGWVSMWSLPLVGEKGYVVSFEPSPANLSILQWHKARNHFPQWTIIPNAVSDKDCDAVEFLLIDTGDSPMNSLTSGAPGMPLMKGRTTTKTSVETITLDTVCTNTGLTPDLVKIDVEGAELLVLRGAAKLVSERRPTIILAVHPYWLPSGQTPKDIFELLSGYGYTIYDSKGKLATYLQSGEYLCLHDQDRSPSLH